MLKLILCKKNTPMKLKCNFSFPDIILANLQEKEVVPTKEKQEIVADAKYDGLSKVTVDKIPDNYIIPSGTITIDRNGFYNVTDKSAAYVNIPQKMLGTKKVTENGIYKATDDNLDGYSQVEVATSGVDITEYMGNTISESGREYAPPWLTLIKKLRDPINITTSYTGYLFQGYPSSELPQLIFMTPPTNGIQMFRYSGITEIPNINYSAMTNMQYMFANTQIENVDTFDISSSSPLFASGMFRECTKLKTFNKILIPNAITSLDYWFYACSNLQKAPSINTGNVSNFSAMYNNDRKIEEIPKYDMHSATNISGMIYGLVELVTLGGLENLGQAYLTTVSANYSNYKLDLSRSTKLTHDSLMNVVNNLYDIATKGCKAQQLVLGNTNKAKLTSEEILSITTKGWTVS